ncbi:hypothetical protein BGX28_003098 [Mortierella sp. GBA30]|nr:hypothetical protein BGX28_003098 [Mortierella sp. GBA30]
MYRTRSRQVFLPPPPPGPGPRIFASGVHIPYFKREPPDSTTEARLLNNPTEISALPGSTSSFAFPTSIQPPAPIITSAPIVAPAPVSISTPVNIPAPVVTSTPTAPAFVTPATTSSRKNFTSEQKEKMEALFLKNPKPSLEQRMQLAEEIDDTEPRVRKWMEYRRYTRSKMAGGDSSAASTPNASPASTPPPDPFPVQTAEDLASRISSTIIESHRARSETPSADGVLGSSSVRYRPYAVPLRPTQPLRNIVEKKSADKNAGSAKLSAFDVGYKLSPLLRGGSVTTSENIPQIAEIMASVNDMDGKKYILNALLSTKSKVILQKFLNSTGLATLRSWLADAMENLSNIQNEETVMKIVNILKALPFDADRIKETKLGKSVKQLVAVKDCSRALAKSVSELKDQWIKANTGSTSSARSSSTSTSSLKKSTRGDISLYFGDHQTGDMSLLPKFTKAKYAVSPGAVPKPRITGNPDFFNEIAGPAIAAPPPTSSKNSRSGLTVKTQISARVDSGPLSASSPRLMTAQQSSASKRSTSNSSAPDPGPSAPAVMAPPVPVHTQSPAFNPSSSQHDKAREAGMILMQSQKQKQKKTVRFKADFELVAVRFIERVDYDDFEDTDDEDFDDHRADQNRHEDVDMGDHWHDDNGEGARPWESPWMDVNEPVIPEGPAFTMPDNVIHELVQGTAWIPPCPLSIELAEPVAQGEGSLEKDVQAKREEETPAQSYKGLASIPPSPAEPDPDQDPNANTTATASPNTNPASTKDIDTTRAMPLFEASPF